jgi:hypothetical protein
MSMYYENSVHLLYPSACKVGFINRFNEFQITHTLGTLLREMNVTSSMILNPRI